MRRLEIALGLAAVTSTATAVLLFNELKVERALTADLRAQLSAHAAAAGMSQPTAADLPAAATSILPAAHAESTPTPRAPASVTGRSQDPREDQRQLLKDPRYVEAVREQRRLSYRLRRDNAMRIFGFSQQTADAIVDADIDSELQMMAFDPAISGEGLRTQYEAVQRDHDAKLLALLGQQRFDQWQTYMETRGTRMQVDRFRTQLNGTDALRDDQVEPLITALAAEQKQMQADLEEYRNTLSWEGDATESYDKLRARQVEIAKAGHKRMLASAGSILSASQVQRLSDMLNAELQERATQDRIETLRQKIGPATRADSGSN